MEVRFQAHIIHKILSNKRYIFIKIVLIMLNLDLETDMEVLIYEYIKEK